MASRTTLPRAKARVPVGLTAAMLGVLVALAACSTMRDPRVNEVHSFIDDVWICEAGPSRSRWGGSIPVCDWNELESRGERAVELADELGDTLDEQSQGYVGEYYKKAKYRADARRRTESRQKKERAQEQARYDASVRRQQQQREQQRENAARRERQQRDDLEKLLGSWRTYQQFTIQCERCVVGEGWCDTSALMQARRAVEELAAWSQANEDRIAASSAGRRASSADRQRLADAHMSLARARECMQQMDRVFGRQR